MSKSLKFGNCIVCEYIAKGEKNKHILINAFSGDIIVADFPALLRIALYVEFFPPIKEQIETIFEMQLNQEIIAKLVAKTSATELGIPGVIEVPAMELSIGKDALFSVFAHCQGYKRTKVISKKIYKDSAVQL